MLSFVYEMAFENENSVIGCTMRYTVARKVHMGLVGFLLINKTDVERLRGPEGLAHGRGFEQAFR